MDCKNSEDVTSQTNKSLNSMKNILVDCIWTTKKLMNRIENNELNTDSGLSILHLKNKMFLNYLIDIVGVVKNKLLGEDNQSTLERIVEERVVLEKIIPIEEKLKYQMDMLMKILNTGQVDQNPLNSKPDFSFALEDADNEQDGQHERQETSDDQMEMNDDGDDNDTSHFSAEQSSKNKNQLYVPPRLAQMKYEDEQERRARNLERAKKRAINSSIINELRKEFDDTPEEEFDGLVSQKSGIGKFLKNKKRYEEENFIRLSLTKKQKAQARKLSTVNSIADDVTRFEDISVLDIKNSDDFVPAKKKVKKYINKKKHKSKRR